MIVVGRADVLDTLSVEGSISSPLMSTHDIESITVPEAGISVMLCLQPKGSMNISMINIPALTVADTDARIFCLRVKSIQCYQYNIHLIQVRSEEHTSEL